MRIAALALIFLLPNTSVLQAQVTVQQPAVETIGVATSVSVPDRGTTFLGGVSSAAASRQSNGPLRTYTNRTSALTSSSMTATVRIIDLHEMDEAILGSDDIPAESSIPLVRTRTLPAEQSAAVKIASPIEKVAQFEKLALQAESAGKSGVARLHWQMAAKYGSTLAQAKLKPDPARNKTAAKN